jgi:hypothetical protein
MTETERKEKLDSIAHSLLVLRHQLSELLPYLPTAEDQEAVESLMTDLIWGAENCTTIALHQIGEALEDRLGMRTATRSPDTE